MKKKNLKKKKSYIEDKKNTYNVDIKNYKLFIEEMKKNPNFEIPEMFIYKFNLMNELEKDNKLTFDNFFLRYKPNNYSNYSNLF